MRNLYSLLKKLNPLDFIVIVFVIFLTGLNLYYYTRISHWHLLVLVNLTVIILIFVAAYYNQKQESRLIAFIHRWYIVPLLFLTFKELYLMVKPIREIDFDHYLIAIDRWLFGFDVTVELYKIANPILTEILQISYGTFFFLPIIISVELLRNNRTEDFSFTAFSILLGFYLSFIGYFLVPAIGPRFHLHDFFTINQEMPGLLLTNFLRDLVNAGESLQPGMLNPAAVVQRDVFPSGHTQMTLIIMYLSVKLKTKGRYFMIFNGVLLIFSTVYLRYHYLIDVIGGIIFFVLTMWLGKIIYNWWQRCTNKPEFNYPKTITPRKVENE